MLLGSYSIPHLLTMYKDPEQSDKLKKYIGLMIFVAIVWITALILLIYYWNSLDLWAQIFGVVGLFFNSGGALFTLLVIYLGMSDEEQTEVGATKSVSTINQSPSTITPSPSTITPSPSTITPLPSTITPLPQSSLPSVPPSPPYPSRPKEFDGIEIPL